jgi:hypothetical protein
MELRRGDCQRHYRQQQGQPTVKDILGVFEARCKTPKDLHLPPLMLQYAAEWELE